MYGYLLIVTLTVYAIVYKTTFLRCPVSVPNKRFHVYKLYTDEYGIFYVGKGKAARLYTTKTIAKYDTSSKAQYMRKMKALGVEIKLKIVFSTNDDNEARQVEQALIQYHKAVLTNSEGIKTPYGNFYKPNLSNLEG